MKKNLKRVCKPIHPNKLKVFQNVWSKLSPQGGARLIYPFYDKNVILEAADLIKALKFKK